MPKTLFWRTIVILAVPLIVVQLVVGIFFYDRLFRQTTLQKTNEVIQQIKFARGDAAASQALGLGFAPFGGDARDADEYPIRWTI